MTGRLGTVFRYDKRVRRGRLLAKATLSPAGLATGGALVAIGAATVGWPFAIAAGVAAWLTSVVLHLRDPKLVSSLLAPDFDRDLSVLDSQHLPLMEAALAARDQFEEAVRTSGQDLAGMQVRITDVLSRLYDSVVWAQRANRFLSSVDQRGLVERYQNADPSSQLGQELAAQVEEIRKVATRRQETVDRVHATITGIETLAVKAASLALQTDALEQPGGELGELRRQLEAFESGLAEVERSLRTAIPN